MIQRAPLQAEAFSAVADLQTEADADGQAARLLAVKAEQHSIPPLRCGRAFSPRLQRPLLGDVPTVAQRKTEQATAEAAGGAPLTEKQHTVTSHYVVVIPFGTG